ncbi:hypothetical protein, partial [Longimicrobium sp.]|uniref:hypothetical protein n=1 Tax=Longimicrobium sp. TaxID=2029185 RepID=UPI002F93F56C
MINHRNAGIAAGVLALAMAAEPMEAQGPVRVPRSVLERYVGEYEANGNTIKILVAGDTLIREQPGQRHAFVPISETLFRIGAILTTEFVIDAAGGVTQIVSDGVGMESRIRRKGSPAAPPPPPPPAAVRVPRAVLERYVGTYEYIRGQM